MKMEIKKFREYIQKNTVWLIGFSTILILIYSPWLINADNVHVDSEAFINAPGWVYNWLEIGRYGAVLSKWLLGNMHYNPFMSSLFGYLLICLSGILFGYLCFRITEKFSILWSAFGVLMFSCPIFVEQFYFDNQIIEVALAYVLCILAVTLNYYAELRGGRYRWCYHIIALFFMVWCFGTYQIFVVLYVVMVIFLYLLLYRKWEINGEKAYNHYWRFIFQQIFCFLFAFGINTVITKLFFSTSDYLVSQILWGQFSVEYCLNLIIKHFCKVYLAEAIFYSPFYGILSIIAVICAFVEVFQHKECKARILYVGGMVTMQLMPFILTIYMGNVPAIRSQLVYPLVFICNLLFIMDRIGRKNALRYIIPGCCIVIFWSQIQVTTRLIYTDEVRAKEDIRIANIIDDEIRRLDCRNKVIAFVGVPSINFNKACLKGELIGITIFGFSPEIQPHYVNSGARICGISEAMGYSFTLANEDQIMEARKRALGMPAYPESGFVQDMGEYVIVKLGEDAWTEEVLSPSVEKCSEELGQYRAEELIVVVDNIGNESNVYKMQGWMLKENIPSDQTELVAFLWNKSDSELYKVSIAKKIREDVDGAFGNSNLYKNCGYTISFPLDSLSKKIEEFELLVGYRYEGEVYLNKVELSQ